MLSKLQNNALARKRELWLTTHHNNCSMMDTLPHVSRHKGVEAVGLLVALAVSASQQGPKLKLASADDVLAGNLGRVWAGLQAPSKHLGRLCADAWLVTHT